MTTDEAVLDYMAAADDLENLAVVARKDGWTYWSVELMGYAGIAQRAADAEVTDPEPRDVPCGVCSGIDSCLVTVHVPRRVVS